ncbi:hypothetical protein C8A00DRAFT_34539 [Chaetomidium leptoderma]|uniref:Uncharacterized protein n=1 Tax=Chaetomidium leptoderma TaxID=669021 RepID=A0AAN6VL15_9PEZI|nr:hypothetical protein C8A00DRAFT_34539 [Chaetomidium leptoderma]
MVSLRSLITGAVALMAAPIMAAPTRSCSKNIGIANSHLTPIDHGPLPKVLSGLANIAAIGSDMMGELEGRSPAPESADDTLVFEAFREFARGTETLLNILIGKAGILEKVPLVDQPMATVLREVEGVVDTIAITTIDLVKSKATELESEAESLEKTFDVCIGKYEGLKV